MLKRSWLRSAALVAFLAARSATSALAADTSDVPKLASADFGWLLQGGIDYRPVPGKVAPISFDPAYPQKPGNQRGVMERMSDAENANLKPWAQELMRKYNQDVLDGHRAFTAQARCWPGGTPGQLLFPAEPYFFVQTPKEVWMIWQRQQEVRRIFLDVPHSVDRKPSWFGESVGHYENGELIVDTVGFLDKQEFDFVDNWRTPHTKDMHVVERFRLVDGGKGLEATVTVDDPGTFNQPWWGAVRWQRVDRRQEESICAENNQAFEKYFSNQKEYPMPQAKAADF
ncbi:MAG TPA: hypothetical protein VKW08_26355 [Xanthobacteraceae bacterium]|nr:hypothetical protein [Xanthobacteraceae bacterium]